ncbi:XkdX family protein [Bacillus amyloliquefaciens]|uniref:XkdX family protein n=1 Tax=Bacillus amyloliquefaciens TaxID=1390 RepID=UPI00399083ED
MKITTYNYWVNALSRKWATVDQVKEAYQEFNDVTKEELQLGVKNGLVTLEEYKEITGEDYEEAETE